MVNIANPIPFLNGVYSLLKVFVFYIRGVFNKYTEEQYVSSVKLTFFFEWLVCSFIYFASMHKIWKIFI